MKSKLIPHFFLSILLLSSWACTEQVSTETKDAVKTTIKGVIKGTVKSNLGSFQIEADSAFKYIDGYRIYIDKVKNELEKVENSKKLVYGAKVDLKELREILFDSNKADSLDQLYVMFGNMPSDSTGLIFSLQSGADSTWQYYDFTLPCPTGCPDWFELEGAELGELE